MSTSARIRRPSERPEETRLAPSMLSHGGRVLPAVTVDTYNEELRDEEGFVGDRASRRAFRAILADWRDRLKEQGEDPLATYPWKRFPSRSWTSCWPAAMPWWLASFTRSSRSLPAELAVVVRRFLRVPSWKGTERIVIGGGLIASRIGELAMGRASIILKGENVGASFAPSPIIRTRPA